MDDRSRRIARDVALVVAVVAVQAAILHAMGRIPICECGTIELWYGKTDGPGNSQHLADWYTPSHVIHGVLFYALLAWLFPKAPVSTRLVMALGIEAAWEIVENTPMIIDRYREGALAAGYNGDSILNSVMDTLFALVGFVMAARLPIWLVVALALLAEIGVGLAIRDNLTLNVIMLIYPMDAISQWQTGTPGS